MIKSKGYWVPVFWGWLPDKAETSYKVFFLIVKNKLKELGLDLSVKSILCDFELNILKSIDNMLDCDILGCFFHLKKCFQRRVEKKGFKTRYETDEFFNKFINQCSAQSHLPTEDVERGLEEINKKFIFEDERGEEFKKDFIGYINDFWINGCIPPRIWNVFGRSEDLTNNNQEGYNSKINKELKETHPSPGVLLCHIRSQSILAEETLVKIVAGVSKPAQRKAYKKLAQTRLRLKKNYLLARQNGESNAIGDFLSSMGYNVTSAMMKGRDDDYKVSQDQAVPGEDEDLDTSTWVVNNENSVLEELENPDCYSQRKIGRKNKPWTTKKCPSCSFGFNQKSDPKKCHGCDSFTHNKKACVRFCNVKTQFYCKKCNSNPPAEVRLGNPHENTSMTSDSNGNFKCSICNLVLKSKFNLKRHIGRKHAESVVENIENIEDNTTNQNEIGINEMQASTEKPANLVNILQSVGLEAFEDVFKAEHIDLEMLLELRDEEMLDMFKSLGIGAWGLRHKLKRALEDLKLKKKSEYQHS